MKPALIAAVALALIVGFAPRCKAEQQPPNIQEASHDQNPLVILTEFPHEAKAGQDDQPAQDHAPDGDSTAQWILIVITGITAGFICWQAWETRKAAKATEKATEGIGRQADLAEKQIGAIIAENRPWLLISRVDPPFLIPAVEAAQGEVKATHCIVHTKNYGRTPAKVVAISGQLLIGDRIDRPPLDLLRDVDLRVPLKVPGIFPPGDERPAEARLLPDWFITPEVRDSVLKTKAKYLWMCGFVRYRHTYEESTDEYETRFCWLYQTVLNTPEPFWTPAGPDEYNKAT